MNGDLDNLLSSTGIPTIFLNKSLSIRRFTEPATEVMRLVTSDLGRSIEHVKERFEGTSTSDACRRVLETQQPDETEVVAANGRFFMRRISPYLAERGDVDGLCITFVDISEQKQAAQRIMAARDYAEAIIETTRAPLLVLDDDLRVESMNDAFQSTFNVTDRILGQSMRANPQATWYLPELEELLGQVISGGQEVVEHEVTIGERLIAINARPVDLGDENRFVVLSFEDITHHREREAQRHAQQREQELKDDAHRKDRWIATLGHELRNPTGTVANGIKVLKSDTASAEQRSSVIDMMDRQTTHMSRLLDGLLDIARIVSGKLSIERQPVDIAEVGQWALDSVQPLIEDNPAGLVVRIPPRGTVWVKGDDVRLTEVIGNLLTNAVKCTEHGGEICVDISPVDETVVIRVRDTGIGFPSELKSTMFEVFTQGPTVPGRVSHGLGLGLPLIKSLVEAHGGEVQASSEGLGKGSEFRVILPLLRHDVGHDAQAAEQDRLTTPRSRRILIVDDVSDASEPLALLLREYGHTITTASDGPAALVAASSFKPEIALLDLGLPGMDGYELARHLRDQGSDARLIAVTGYPESSTKLTESGFDHHLLKPIKIDRLLELIAG